MVSSLRVFRAAVRLFLALVVLGLGTGASPRKVARVIAYADSLQAAGDPATAEGLYQWAAQSTVRPVPWVQAHIGIANCRAALGHPEEAVPILEGTIAEIERVAGPDHPLLIAPLRILGVIHWQLGDYGAALPPLERAMDLAEPGDPLEYAMVLANYGIALAARGDLQQASGAIRSALDIELAHRGPADPQLARARGNMGYVYTLLGRYPEAREQYEAALAIFVAVYGPDHPEAVQCRYNLGGAAQGAGDLAGARVIYLDVVEARRRLQTVDPATEAAVLASLGGIELVLGEMAAAEGHFAEASALLADRPGHLYAEQAWNGLVHTRRLQGDADGARAAASEWLAIAERQLDTLVGIASERERLLLVDNRRGALSAWLAVHDRPEDAEVAWRAVLRWKGATARAMLGEREAALVAPALRPQWDALVAARAELARLTFDPTADFARVEDALTEKQRLERELAAASPRFAIEAAAPAPEAVCAALPDGAVLVDTFTYDLFQEAHLAAFVVDGDCAIRRVALGPQPEAVAAIVSWREGLTDPLRPTRQVDVAGAKVREQLWDPLELPAGTVVIAPVGVLAYAPFAALPTGGGRYVVETHTIATVESALDLLRWTEPASGTGAVVVGGVDYAGVATAPCLPAFGALPGSLAEADAVMAALGEGALRLSGTEATEAAVAQAIRGKRVVHLATHGFFASSFCDPDGTGAADAVAFFHPMVRSGVVLAAAGNGDGLWTAEEVLAADLRGVELVVLSACETGLGGAYDGESLLGLRRAFAIAGARVLVASLWSVGDADAQALATGLYATPGLAPASALAASQRAHLERMRRDWGEARPQAWGAFVAIGAP